MKPRLSVQIGLAAGALALAMVCQPAARADGYSFTVTTNTSAISGNSTYEIGYTFTDASGTGDGNNTVTISDITFGGGSAGATDPSGVFGGSSGDLTSGVTLTDTNPLVNSYAGGFTAGSTLSFLVTMTTNPDTTIDPSLGIPGDQFAFFLLDSSGVPIPTSNACGPTDTGECALLIATIQGSGSVDVQTFTSDLTGPVQVTPEPGTLALLGSGLAALGWFKKSRKA